MALDRIVLDSAGMAEMLTSPETEAELRRRAEPVADRARAMAPRDTGAYADSIHVEVVDHPTRAVAQVVADVPYAMIVESRTGNLAKSLGAAGGA